jgi:hypothetical protein
MSVQAFKVLRLKQRSPWAEVAPVRNTPPVAYELERLMRGYVNYILEHEPRSAAFLRPQS